MGRSKSTFDNYRYDDEEEDEFPKEAHQRLEAPSPDWDGPIAQRQCTDRGCLLLLLVALIAMSWMGLYATRRGDVRVILYPMDYAGNICGVNFGGHDMTEYPFLLYINSYTGGVCVRECPSLVGLVKDDLTDVRTLITYNGIWQTDDGLAQLQNATDVIRVANYSQSSEVLTCTTAECFPNNNVKESWTSAGIDRGLGFAYYAADTYVMFQRCYVTTEAQLRIANLTESVANKPIGFVNPMKTHEFWIHLYGDLWTARFLIFGFGFAGSLIVSLMYMILLRIPCLLTAIIWGSIVAVVGVLAGAGYYAYMLAHKWAHENPLTSVRQEQIKYTEIASYVLFTLSGLFLLIAVCLRNSIQTAVRCVREAGSAINRMALLLGIPFLQGIVLLAFWVVWGFFSVHLASLGEIKTRSFPVDLQGAEVSMRVFEFNHFVKYWGWYMVFIFFWIAAFVMGVGDMVVSVAISRWYFTEEKRRVNSYWVMGALWTTLRYHLGTVAFGSLLIAIVRLLRAILMRIQRTVTSMTNQQVANMLLCCCQCCLCCLDRVLQFINRNAYIQCAIFGTCFWESGRKAFFLVLRNAGRIGTVSFISGVVLFIGKLLIGSLVTVSAYYTVVQYPEYVLPSHESLHSYGGPLLFIFCIAYFMARMFLSVFDTSILAILHCFVADEEMFDDASRYTNKDFQKWMDQQQQQQQQQQTESGK